MNGVPVAPIPLHMVLTGNPGTGIIFNNSLIIIFLIINFILIINHFLGKTTIARIVAQLYRKMAPRLVQSNKFKELRGQVRDSIRFY